VKPARFPVPEGVVTDTWPVEPAPTKAVIEVGEVTKKDARVPPKLTAVAPVKLFPVIVTCVDCPPLVGANELIKGACA
jgi:hypothetical protein